MKEQNYIEIESPSTFFWSFICICLVLIVIFILHQNQGVKVNTQTMQNLVLTESKHQASPIKKYFPAPYSVKDIAVD